MRCNYCKNTFEPKHKGAKYCSRVCANRNTGEQKAAPRPKCEICGSPTKRKGSFLCSVECRAKYFAVKNKGKTLNTGRTHFKKGRVSERRKGFWVSEKGYIILHKPEHPTSNHKGYIREHRYLMEVKIGRSLEADEVVHHINEIKDDNRLENLQLMTKGEHSRHHLTLRNHNHVS